MSDIEPGISPQLAELFAKMAKTMVFGPDFHDSLTQGMAEIERVGKALAALGWAIPMSLTPAEMFEIFDARTPDEIDRAFVELFESDKRQHFSSTVRGMLARPGLADWRPLLRQTASAYRRGHYVLTVPALLTVLEGVLMRSEGDRTKAIQAVESRISQLGLVSSGSMNGIAWRVVREFIAELYKKAPFTGTRPPVINRHWILHGRDDMTSWTQADSLRLFQAVDTVSSLLD